MRAFCVCAAVLGSFARLSKAGAAGNDVPPGQARGKASPAMTQCVLRGEAQHPSLRRSLPSSPQPSISSPRASAARPGAHWLIRNLLGWMRGEWTPARRLAPDLIRGRGDAECAATLRPTPIPSPFSSFVSPDGRQAEPGSHSASHHATPDDACGVSGVTHLPNTNSLAGRRPRGVAAILAPHRGGAGSREAGPCLYVSA